MIRRQRDVYFSALHLQTAVEGILAGAARRDIDAHLGGVCRCTRPARFGGNDAGTDGADYMADLLKLRDRIEDFRSAFAGVNRRLTGEISFGVYRVAAAVDGVRCVVVQAEADLAAPRAKKCAGQALLRLGEHGERLQTRVAELNVVLGAPDAMASKWLPKQGREACGSEARVGDSNPRQEIHSSGTDSPPSVEELREMVRRHCACYEVLPEWSAGGGPRAQIGYGLSICGVNEADGAAPGRHTPGCSHCRRTYDGLRNVVEWVTPKEEMDCHFEIVAFDRAWHVAPAQRRARREVVATVKILHRRDVNAPVDDCQRRCLKEMRAKLAELGVQDGVWQPAQAAAS